MGRISDTHSMHVSFVVPLVSYALITIYGAVWQKPEAKGCLA